MTEKAYKEWLTTEYTKKKQSTVDALKQLSLDDLSQHLTEYKEFMLSLVLEHEQSIVDASLQPMIEKQLRKIDSLESYLKTEVTTAFVNIMLDEEIIVHIIGCHTV